MARRVVSHYREHMTPDDLSSPEEELLKFANHILRTPRWVTGDRRGAVTFFF